MQSSSKPLILPALGFVLLLALVALAFLPGLGGIFVFDDQANLQPWQTLGDIDSWQKAGTFAFSANTLPGRPLALLSFLIDDQSWMPDIVALKRTNLAIHLLNACLVFWLALRLLALSSLPRSPRHAALLALFTAAVWSLHPLQVSNVSYIIQRMNLLSTLLVLAGLLLYVHGRAQLATAPRQALLACSLAIGAFMPLAVLAKENGLLLCAFALLVERFFFAPVPGRAWRAWKILFLWLPLLAFLAYCLVSYRFFTVTYPNRDFNSWERMLTQGPVLLDYLDKLLLPRLQGTGLYFDNFPVSRSLFHPAITLVSWLALLALLAGAWFLRRRQPVVSFGIFFYFCGHLMESTLLPLELYFEHRNYLPQFGLWLALAALGGQARTAGQRQVALLLGIALAVLLAIMTHSNARLWSQPELQAAVWHRENPGSLRSTLAHADQLSQHMALDQAYAVLSDGLRYHPNSLALEVSRRYVRCYLQGRPTRFDGLEQLARHSDPEYASIIMLQRMWNLGHDAGNSTGNCTPASSRTIAAIYQALLQNPRMPPGHTHSRLYEYLAEIAVTERDLNAAMNFYDKAFASKPNPIYPYRQAILLESAGLPEAAREYARQSRQALGLRERAQYPDLSERLDQMDQRLARSPNPRRQQP